MSDPAKIPVGPEFEDRDDGGESLSNAQLAERHGIIRHATETYSIGGFRYTSLTDAIAQARRMTKLEQELLG